MGRGGGGHRRWPLRAGGAGMRPGPEGELGPADGSVRGRTRRWTGTVDVPAGTVEAPVVVDDVVVVAHAAEGDHGRLWNLTPGLTGALKPRSWRMVGSTL